MAIIVFRYPNCVSYFSYIGVGQDRQIAVYQNSFNGNKNELYEKAVKYLSVYKLNHDGLETDIEIDNIGVVLDVESVETQIDKSYSLQYFLPISGVHINFSQRKISYPHTLLM